MNFNKGNTFIISIIFIAIVLTFFVFIALIFVGETNSILYNIKLDMYSINKSAIIAVNKGITSRERFSYDKKAYKEYFMSMLKKNYNLDDKLKNSDGLIQNVEIKEYEIIKKGARDNFTQNIISDSTIHSVIKVKIKPIFFEDLLRDVFTFVIHEDVALNEMIS